MQSPVNRTELGEKFLDHVWAADRDEIQFQLIVNMFRKVEAAKMGPDMTADDLEELGEIVFTRRRDFGDYKLVL